MPSVGNVHSLYQPHPPVGVIKGHLLQAEERALILVVVVILRYVFSLSHSATTCANNFGRHCIYSPAAQMYSTIHLAVVPAPHRILHHLHSHILALSHPLALLHPRRLSRVCLPLVADHILDHLPATLTVPILSHNQRLDRFNFPHQLPWKIHTIGVAKAHPMNLLAGV